jgi:DNA-binding NarL/FixJ family response regulator
MNHANKNQKMTILIVDNNPCVRRLLKRLLAEIDATIVECGDGAFALAAFNDHHPDIVLMDIRMPLQDGLTTTRQIRRHHPSAKIVIVTDYTDDEFCKAASEAGAFAYVVKQDLTNLAEFVRSAGNQQS